MADSGYGAPYGTCVYGTAPSSSGDPVVQATRGGRPAPGEADDTDWQPIRGLWRRPRLGGPLIPVRRKVK